MKPIKVFRAARGGRDRAAAGLDGLLNLGPKSTQWLAAIGLRSREQLVALGPIEICRQLRAAGNPVNVLMAYALDGTLTDTRWNELPPETKQWRRAEFLAMKRSEAARRAPPSR